MSSQHVTHNLNLGYNRLLASQLYQDHVHQDGKPVQINKLCFLFLISNFVCTTSNCYAKVCLFCYQKKRFSIFALKLLSFLESWVCQKKKTRNLPRTISSIASLTSLDLMNHGSSRAGKATEDSELFQDLLGL